MQLVIFNLSFFHYLVLNFVQVIYLAPRVSRGTQDMYLSLITNHNEDRLKRRIAILRKDSLLTFQ